VITHEFIYYGLVIRAITGASGGFGKLTSLTLLKNGRTVVASMRGINNKNASVARELSTAGAHVVEIDVTNDISVNQGDRMKATSWSVEVQNGEGRDEGQGHGG
jgi:NADP-dependent 3-hydroxy acid dehydrogenase YdfG